MLPPRIRRVFRLDVRGRDQVQAELDEEIRTHFEARIETLMARGATRADAELEAARRFGPLDEGRELMLAAARNREEKLLMRERLDRLRSDFRHAFRQMRRAPAFAAAIIFTFALGVGANSTMFGVIERLLLRPPAHVINPEQLYQVRAQLHFRGEPVLSGTFSYPTYTDIRDNVPAFASVAMQTSITELAVDRGAAARRVRSVFVSGNYFATLGVRPAAGRLFVPEDAALPTGNRVAVISHALWQAAYGGAQDVLERSLDFGKVRIAIVGVAPPGFYGVGLRQIDVWMPVSADFSLNSMAFLGDRWSTERNATWLSMFGRLAPGASTQMVDAQATAVYRSAQLGVSGADSTARIQVESILPLKKKSLSADAKVASLLALVALLVLLIACANVANLLLARALRRQREVAVRLALGISRYRLMKLALIESLLLATLGGAGALVVAAGGTAVMQRVFLSGYAWPESLIDGQFVAFTAVVAGLAGFVSGIFPALQSSNANLAGMLREGSQGSGVQRTRLRSLLLQTQGVLAVVLLVGTGLFLRSLANVANVDLGVDTKRIVRVTVPMLRAGYPADEIVRVYEQLQQAVARIPGVNAATLGDGGALGASFGAPIFVPGIDSLPIPRGTGPNIIGVGSDYFKTMGTRVVRGRAISQEDIHNKARVAIVSEEMAARVWPRREAVGQCIKVFADTMPCNIVVGVVANIHQNDLEESEALSMVYLPLAHGVNALRARTLFVRASGESADQLLLPIRQTIQATVRDLPYPNIEVLHSALDSEIRPWRLGTTMFGIFGGIALLLTAVGLYSMITYTIGQRMRELGIRIALGAQAAGIVRLVMAYGFWSAVASVFVGGALALIAGRYVKTLLFHVSPYDPAVFAGVSVLLIVVAVGASVVPALRATRADPLAAFKSD